MSVRLKKNLLLVLAALLLFGTSRMQNVLNQDREKLGLTRVQPLENAPPVLAFTTVALGGFRGLISNLLWIRATELQENDKFFEMSQLADWITKLEPHFSIVWTHQAWNMAYNISVKFKETAPGEFPDRWRWVKRGIELLRDEGLKYNPNDVGIHQQLAWIFQHKMGANLDDANMYYKRQWATELTNVFGRTIKSTLNLDELVHPQTDDEKNRARILRERFKMDPAFMQELNERYGPLEWRLPEAHAIYWAAEGLKKAKENPTKVNADDLIQLRRVIYQDMQLSFQRGRLEADPFQGGFELGPNLDIIPKAVAAYEEAMQEDEKNRDHIERAHRNLLRQAVYFLYINNRVAEAAKWYKYLGDKYPNRPVLDQYPNLFYKDLTLDQYAVAFIQEDISETSKDRIQSAIEGYLVRGYYSLVLGDDDRYAGHVLMARKIWEVYRAQIPKDRWDAIHLAPVDEIAQSVLRRLLDPETGYPPEMRAILRTRLRLPAETNSPPATAPQANSAPPANSQ
jgi:hypothetical protein